MIETKGKTMNKKCPCCMKKGTTEYNLKFYTCDEHNDKDVFRTILKNKGVK